MKLYAASFRALVEGEAVDGWNEAAVVLYSDVADLERRYREAVELLRGIRDDIKCQANNRGGIVDRIDYALADEQEDK